MTRAFVNFVYLVKGEKEVLQFYYNGDQYPFGLKTIFNLFQLLDSKFKKNDFLKWAKKNYNNVEIEKLKFVGKDFVLDLLDNESNFKYDDNKRYYEDYSYIFDSINKKVLIHNWGTIIFNDSLGEFKKWLKKVDCV